MVKRILDIVAAAILLLVFGLPMIMIAFLIRWASPGPAFHWSDRIGRDNGVFRMPKFRTMRTDTPQLATHLLADPDRWLTPIGRVLRKTSIDELPQLWSILTGRMSFVGPRPALFNQNDLVEMRTQVGAHRLTPGLTGWAQVNGRDELSIAQKVAFDEYYMRHASLLFDLRVLWMTVAAVFQGDGIREGADESERSTYAADTKRAA